jgi:hypothetical protein
MSIETVAALRAEIDAEIERLSQVALDNLVRARKAEAEVEQLRVAIYSTASDGTYNESAIRKAVSFELAELIVDARAALAGKDTP